MLKRFNIRVTGIVQGVGFRPFVFNLARSLALGGWVWNTSAGVEIEVEGQTEQVNSFYRRLQGEFPPLARLDSVEFSERPLQGERKFVIRPSSSGEMRTVLISPDVATCPDCRRELLDSRDRHFRYPFINCTHCGPRYSIIKDVPYDRASTTMAEFPMCLDCQTEYNNPADRRFHAQPNACPVCGPSYRLLDKTGEPMEEQADLFGQVRQLIQAGAIVAIKGIGGYHLACDAFNGFAVDNLRRRKVREDKPFAVMGGSMAAVRQMCLVNQTESEWLTGTVRPIVLLIKGTGYCLASGIAPGSSCIGVMLPYAPVHWLLLQPDDVWVMTSGNRSDEPIAYEDADAKERLFGIADYFLVHNRMIYRRVDDSVLRVVKDKPYMLRRSRGFAPAPVALAGEYPCVLAVGGELKNTFCLTRGRQAFLSAHIGDLENLATYQSYCQSIAHYQKLFDIRPEMVAYDLHPDYLATKYALSLELPGIGVQHHHAHIVSVLAEYGINEPVIGVALDGTGYGTDGNLWGGEFLLADCRQFVRLGHCRYLHLPGGEKAIREPWRLAVWLLYELYGKEFVRWQLPLAGRLPTGWELLVSATAQGINAPLSSGVGRLFDAAAALLGLRSVIHYEGQAAVELEQAAERQAGTVLPYDIQEGQPKILDFRPVFAAMVEKLRQGKSSGELAAAFHTTLAAAVVDMVGRISRDTGIRRVALSGGVWQNMTLLNQVIRMLQQNKLMVYIHRQVPSNDGGLALGQAIIAGEKIKESR
ncbi:MAG: carbamoyltransferase HypF [Veillonellales bacterium]